MADDDFNRRIWGSVQIDDEALRYRAIRADAIDVAASLIDNESGEQDKVVPLAAAIAKFVEHGTVPVKAQATSQKPSTVLKLTPKE